MRGLRAKVVAWKRKNKALLGFAKAVLTERDHRKITTRVSP